jgi:hypothetical protein
MSDGGWLNAPAGLLRRDGSSKPAYDELLKLIKGEWWVTPVKRMTDNRGEIQFGGCPGEYGLSYAGKQISFTVTREDATGLEIRL